MFDPINIPNTGLATHIEEASVQIGVNGPGVPPDPGVNHIQFAT